MDVVADLEHARSLDAMSRAYRASKSTTQPLVEIPTSIVRDLLNARDYNSTRGQFLSQDPVFLALGSPGAQQLALQNQQRILSDPQKLNAYSYAKDNPITNKDPSGKIAGVDDAAGFVIGGALGTAIYAGESALQGSK